MMWRARSQRPPRLTCQIDEGKIKRGTKAKRRRGSRDKVQSDVIVQGAFYWRFLEYGQGPDGVEYAMFLKGIAGDAPGNEPHLC
jgi:hypothetical protein